MPKMINARELKRLYATMGPHATVAHLEEALAEKHLKPEHFSVRDLFSALVENGDEMLAAMSYRKSGGMRLMEAAGLVDTSAFSNITGQIVYNKVRDLYESPEFLWPQLCTTQPTEFLDGEKIPGIGEIGDKAEVVDEAQMYPTIGLNEEWIMTGRTIKRGFIIPLTRESIIADRTGVLLTRAGNVGRWLGLNKEKRIIDLAVGITNNYNRNGVSYNTYLTSGAYINDQTGNALDTSGNEWRALEKADLLFDAIVDPNTNEPILVKPTQLLVPTALLRSANRILSASEIQTVDMRANVGTVRTTSANPYGGSGVQVLSSPYVKLRSSSATKWFWGDFKRALLYMEVWAIETLQAATNSEPEFTQDISMRWKVSERGVAQVYESRFLTRNDA